MSRVRDAAESALRRMGRHSLRTLRSDRRIKPVVEYWKARDFDRPIHIKDMSDAHLLAAVKMCQRNAARIWVDYNWIDRHRGDDMPWLENTAEESGEDTDPSEFFPSYRFLVKECRRRGIDAGDEGL